MHVSPRTVFAACLVGAVSLTGCATHTRPVVYRGIESADRLQPNAAAHRGHEPFAYEGSVDWRSYHTFMMDPVVLYRGGDAQFVKLTEAEKGDLAIYMDQQFRTQMQQRYSLVQMPARDTLRLRVTLTGASRSTRFLSTFTKMDLGGGPVNAVKSMTGGEGMFMGSISYAVEVFDATSGELLKAYVDKQYPNAMNFRASFGPLTAAKTGIDKSAQAFVESLDR